MTSNNDDISEISEDLRELLKFDEMRSQLADRVIDSLGPGYDEKSLMELDQKLCLYHLPEDDYYYDGDNNKNLKKKSENGGTAKKPTKEDMERCENSIVIRKKVLNEATNVQATNNFLGGDGIKNLQLYQNLYKDIKTYWYAWSQFIFKERTCLYSVCSALIKFMQVKIDYKLMEDVDDIMMLLQEQKDEFEINTDPYDEDECESAGILECDYYDVCYFLSEEMACKGNVEKSHYYFDLAFSAENVWGYSDRYCAKALEYAIGRKLTSSDLSKLGDYGMDNEGFFYKCLRAMLEKRRGIVSWCSWGDNMHKCCENCGISKSLLGKPLLRCARCKSVYYCTRECQMENWKRHKKSCNNE